MSLLENINYFKCWYIYIIQSSLKYYVTEYFGMITGGPQKYSGRNMKELQKILNISNEDWDVFLIDLKVIKW